MKPPMPYYGGKQTAANRIVSLFPRHDGYIEPYAGSLAVLLAKPVEPLEVANDISRHLVTFWRVLRDRTDELVAACELTPHSRVELDTARDFDSVDEVEIARRVWVQLTQARSASWKSTGWRFFTDPHGTSASMSQYLDGYKKRLDPAAGRLMNVQLECRNALDVVREYGRHRDNLLYVDPPYVGSTRKSSGYQHEMKEDAEHEALLDALLSCNSAVVLSGYASELYDDALIGWERHVIGSKTQGSDRTEVVWVNRLSDNALFALDEVSA